MVTQAGLRNVALAMSDPRHDPRAAFLEAATWHRSLERAEVILAAHPELASSDIHTAAILGDDAAVRRFLERDQANATAKSDSYWTERCSRESVKALLDAGASTSGVPFPSGHAAVDELLRTHRP